ncbi:molybdopterin molybdotransferase MoeA [Desulfolucanica intricata]|uniref:molybdopterin molybdotransferase MoeA n=1 Tax=Desulfolucanica intricata TaxID=1285191 RepID=UPI000829A933|nr:gephyrin-like molybdotransferase Glp [Desulfolucanica intricata]
MLTDVHLEEAQELLLSCVTPLTCQYVPLPDVLGRVSYQDIYAEHDIPSCSQSAVDGYAVSIDEQVEGTGYMVKERLKPGELPGISLGPGQACGVVTGGPLPAGTGAVVPQELADLKGKRVTFKKEIQPGSNIKLPGEDFKAGELIAQRGTPLSPGLVGVLAAYGKSKVAVFARPRTAILSLGREIVPYYVVPGPAGIRDSNGPLLAAYVQRAGGEVAAVEAAGDDNPSQVKYLLEKLLKQADIVITTGGAASGVCDQALSLLRETGARPLFWGVKIKPGSHSGAVSYNSKLIISLSGNPAACAVGFHLLAAPVLRALQGLTPQAERLTAVCTNPFLKRGGPRRFIRGNVFCGQKGWQVAILPGQKSSMLRSLINCNALIDLPAGHSPVEEGEEVSVILL